ncbi:serine hydrolase [uncultured Flavobacterium sp.]|uniref:serine hydrolase n=1 Tax=uncultured Flavobacterium sp. TaxID=165435 RepID=UPI0025F64FF1|nr:serine hydrolase [uncultured Flavobacterium sp.]
MKKIAVFILLAFGSAGAQDRLAAIDSIFTTMYANKQFNGNVLIAEKGNVVYQKSFGLRNEETGEALDENSVFELASLSKQFTAMAIVLLAEKGKLKYDDKLSKFFPELGFYKEVTVRHLLNHTGGLPDYMELMEKHWDRTKIAANRDIISLFATEKPAAIFPSGTKYEYSNTGYALLASVIEKASGMTFADFLRKNIFIPLKMNDTFVYTRRYAPHEVKNYAYGYVTNMAGTKVLPDNHPATGMVVWMDGIVGDGTVNSTTGDLLKWDRALYGDKLASKKSRDLIFSIPALPKDEKSNYGFGWIVESDKEFGKIASHSGGWPGYYSYIEREMDNDKTIIILQNNDTGARLPISTIRRLLYGLPVKAKRQEVVVPAEKMMAYVGEYELAPGYTMQITYDNGLKTQLPGQQRFDLFAENEAKFFLKVVDAQLEFFLNEKGTPDRAVLYQNGREVTAKKIK